MNLADPELELIDPTPNVCTLFVHFDQLFFWTKLANRAVVRWSKRMYSCAGTCSYEGRGGLCDIALSEPLLKLRPRKDLIETLIHEMIHAYLFITCRDLDRDGHGPNFQSHMHRINKAAGLNISIYHDFHDEVELYQTHWWRCNGPCQTRRPKFGIVRRSANRAPGPSDYWWKAHQWQCGGTFIKIKEPEKKGKAPAAAKPKPKADIAKFLTPSNNDKNVTSTNNNSKINVNNNTPQNGKVVSPQINQIKSSELFSGNGHILSGGRPRSNSIDVAETVRNVWAKKGLSVSEQAKITNIKAKKSTNDNNNRNSTSKVVSAAKTKAVENHTDSPPRKILKIDDYFKTNVSNVLKDVYGEDFKITQKDNSQIVAVAAPKVDFVDCPICGKAVNNNEINRHLDLCLNTDVIEKLSKENVVVVDQPIVNIKIEGKNTLKEIIGEIPQIPTYKNIGTNNLNIKKEDSKQIIDLTNIKPHVDHMADLKVIYKKTDDYIKQIEPLVIPDIETQPSTSKEHTDNQKCPCCGLVPNKPIEQHLDECLAFFDDVTTIPTADDSTRIMSDTIAIDDDDDFDETLTLNATGTKSPCPCCLKMIEQAEMNDHLDLCLS